MAKAKKPKASVRPVIYGRDKAPYDPVSGTGERPEPPDPQIEFGNNYEDNPDYKNYKKNLKKTHGDWTAAMDIVNQDKKLNSQFGKGGKVGK